MDRLVTVIGGSGFIGRYVVQELARRGERIRVLVRSPQRATHLMPLGALGQIQVMGGDLRSAATMAAACDGADAVVNLVGILAPGGGNDFESTQARGSGNAAQAAARTGVTTFVQVSAIGADPASESRYGRTKGEGEALVRAAMPAAAILRPSIVFGPEDGFTNRFAALAKGLPVVAVVAGRTRFQPVQVVDVARAIADAATKPAEHAGRTYELGGPTVYTMRQIIDFIVREIRVKKPVVEVPDAVASLMARAGSLVPGAPITWDQWLMLQRDNVVSPGMAGLEAFGIAPTPMEAVAPGWLVRYRRGGRFNRGPRDPSSQS